MRTNVNLPLTEPHKERTAIVISVTADQIAISCNQIEEI